MNYKIKMQLETPAGWLKICENTGIATIDDVHENIIGCVVDTEAAMAQLADKNAHEWTFPVKADALDSDNIKWVGNYRLLIHRVTA